MKRQTSGPVFVNVVIELGGFYPEATTRGTNLLQVYLQSKMV